MSSVLTSEAFTNDDILVRMIATVSLLCLALAGPRGCVFYSWRIPKVCVTCEHNARKTPLYTITHYVHHQEAQHQIYNAKLQSGE